MHGTEKPNINEWLSETYTDDKKRFDFLKKKIIKLYQNDFGLINEGHLKY